MKTKIETLISDHKIPILILIFMAFFVFLSFSQNPPLSEQEIINIASSRSLLSDNLKSENYLNFLKENAFISKVIPNVWNFTILNFLSQRMILDKLPGIIILYLVFLLYNKTFIANLLSSKYRLKNELPFVLILLTSPWLLQSAIYKPNTLIGLLFFIITGFFFYKFTQSSKNRKVATKYVLFFNFLLALTGIMGFLSAISLLIFLSIYLILKRKRSLIPKIYFAGSIILLSAIFIINKNSYMQTLQKGSLLTKLYPSEIAHRIDERQMIDYLAANKKFLLPPLIRKFTYNKVSYALDITIRKSISLFDFEQFASPNQSYDIVKLSGILPQGNIPLIYVWEITIFILGVFFIYRDHKDKCFWFTSVLIASLIPALVFEKKDFPQYGLFFHLPIFIAEVIAVTKIYKYLSDKKIAVKIITIPLYLIIFFSSLNFINFLFFQDFNYLPTNIITYQKISKYLNDNYSKSNDYVITNRFGPTQYAIPAYLGLTFENYWDNYNAQKMTYKNLSFEQIDFSKIEPEKQVYYIGFPAEFLGKLDTYDIKLLPSYYEMIDSINLDGELVYNYGKDIWVVKPK